MKEFSQFLQQHRPALEESIKNHIGVLCNEVLSDSFAMDFSWQDILNKKLVDYASGGKMLRGILVLYWAHLYGHAVERDSSLFSVAASLELLQMFLLIHDDIMDEDEMRRNMPSMHVQLTKVVRSYASSVPSLTNSDASRNFAHIGKSLAICVGDIVFSHAIGTMQAAMPLCHAGRAVNIFSNYVSRVGLAQMNDMYWECSNTSFTRESILSMYAGKTGHYTFTLPSLMGYLYFLASIEKSIDEDEILRLMQLGSLMGQVFQIYDDVLDIRYSSSITGKTRGSDCMKKKQTFFQWKLFECAVNHGKRTELETMFRSDITTTEVDIIGKWAEQWGVYDEIQKECDDIVDDIAVCIRDLRINAQGKERVLSFVQYLTKRSS